MTGGNETGSSQTDRRVLAGDVGGTKTNLGLYEVCSGALHLVRQASYPSDPDADIVELLRGFAGDDIGSDESTGAEDSTGSGESTGSANPVGADATVDVVGTVGAVCIGVAGPVVDGAVQATNLPWEMSEAGLSRDLGGLPVRLLNDLEANVHGIGELPPSDLKTLQTGSRGSGPCVLIAAGTGLGEAIFLPRPGEDGPIVIPTEGGHSDFAPSNPDDVPLLDDFWKRFEHVSVERIVSGPGLHEIYRVLGETGRWTADPEVARRIESADDPSAEVSRAGLAVDCSLCAESLSRFVRLYGAETSNLALKALATGGVYIGGGIAPKILPALERGEFLEAFLSKGRMRGLLERMPVTVILNQSTALLGAARVAARALVPR